VEKIPSEEVSFVACERLIVITILNHIWYYDEQSRCVTVLKRLFLKLLLTTGFDDALYRFSVSTQHCWI